MVYGDTTRRARRARVAARPRCVAAAAIALALCRPPAAPASETALAARALPAALTLDESALPSFPASAFLVERGLCIEWAAPAAPRADEVEPEVALDYPPRSRASAVVGNRLRAALSADETSASVVLASARGWGVSLGYEAAGTDWERVRQDPDRYRLSAETQLDERFQAGVGWRIGGERLYEVGIMGSLYYERSVQTDSTRYDFLDEPEGSLRRSWTRHDEIGIGVTARSLSAGAGPQVALSLYLERPRVDHGKVPALDQFQREARLDGAWRVSAAGLDDLLLGASVSWTDRAVLVSIENGDTRDREVEERETVYTGFAFLSAETAIGKHVVVRAGGRAPAWIGKSAHRTTHLDGEGGHDSIKGAREATGSVLDPEVAAGFELRWRRIHFDALVRDTIGFNQPASRWSLTVLL